MATERQIAANRLNARNSTGPRSSAAKRRTSLNAYRHGLAARHKPSPATARRLDQLARQIAGDSNSVIVFELARFAAQAEFDLARVRRSKVALIKQVSAFGIMPQTSDPFSEDMRKSYAKFRRLRAEARNLLAQLRLVKAGLSDSIEPLPPMPDPVDP